MRKAFLIGVILLACSSIISQETARERQEMAINQIKRAAVEISARSLTNIDTITQWTGQREKLRTQLLEMLGLAALPKRTPLRAEITGTLQRAGYRIEKVVFQSSPGLYVTGNFYVPRGRTNALPTILYLCGHAPHPSGAKVNYQDRAAWFASHGFACLILDSLEFGEVPGIHHGTHDLNMWNWLSLGYTPAGTEVWNGMRALDYLETRPEVDRSRIGVTGISGGGAITWYLSAVDERVAAAAPVCSTFTFGSQATHWRAFGQCDCIYFHNTYALDFPVVAALIAPRPLLMVSGRKDDDFPPDGYHEVFTRARRIYDLYSAPEKVKEFDDEVGHSDPPQFLREARQWMQLWLKGDTTVLGLETNKAPGESAQDLACLRKAPLDSINDHVQNLLTKPVKPRDPKSKAEWTRRRSEILTNLDQKTFRWFPVTKAAFETLVSRNDGGWASRYGNYKEATFQTDAGVRVRAQLFTPKGAFADSPLLLYVKRPGDSIYFMDLDELLPLLGRQSVLVLNPRFTEISLSASEYRDVQMSSAWSGRTIASMQVWDVLRTLDWAVSDQKLNPKSVSIYGKGEMALVAMHAAARDSRFRKIVVSDPPASYWQSTPLLNALRITDIPELAGTLAPRNIVFLGSMPAGFNLTAAIYPRIGAKGGIGIAPSLRGALVESER